MVARTNNIELAAFRNRPPPPHRPVSSLFLDAVVAPAAEMEQLAAQFTTMLGFGVSAERSMAVLRRLGPCAPTQKSRKSLKLTAFSLLRSTRFELVTPSV